MSFIERTTERKVIQEHSLEVGGTHLCEKVVTTHHTEGGSNEAPVRTEKVHTRWIGGRMYTVSEVEEEGQGSTRSVTTSMTDDEVQAFLEEWELLWNPKVDEAVVARAQEVPVHAGACFAHHGEGMEDEQPEGE